MKLSNNSNYKNKKIIKNKYIKDNIPINKNKIKNAFNFNIDDEWYTTKEDVQNFINEANISKNRIIWCPFDLNSSNFVTILKKKWI